MTVIIVNRKPSYSLEGDALSWTWFVPFSMVSPLTFLHCRYHQNLTIRLPKNTHMVYIHKNTISHCKVWYSRV